MRSKGLHCSTLSTKYDAERKDATWICAFCKRGPHASELTGELFFKHKFSAIYIDLSQMALYLGETISFSCFLILLWTTLANIKLLKNIIDMYYFEAKKKS